MTERQGEYQFFKSIKVCVRCHKNAAEPHKVLCMECADADAIRTKKYRENHKETVKKRDLDKYYALKENGICVYCRRRKAIAGKTKCSKCLAIIRNKRNQKKNTLSRSEWVSYGLCYICGKNPLYKDKKVCESCYKKRCESIAKIMYMPVSEYWKQDNNLVFKQK